MLVLLIAVHVLICLFLIIVVLLQSGKAADLAGAFGGMGSQTAFGPRGAATVLSKATTVAAVLFMITSITLTIVYTRSAKLGASVLERQRSTTKTTPGAPVPAAPVPGQGGTPMQPGKPFDVQVQQQPPAPAQQKAPATEHSQPAGHNAPNQPAKK